jgi:tryptophan-rich sensory protein
MNDWYASLIKPAWAPPSWIFGPVWTVLYAVIIVTFGWVFLQTVRGQLPLLVALPFFLNIIFNLLFTPIQFGLRINLLASIDILLVLGTLIWALVAIWPHARLIVYANIPYLLWVAFATTVQLAITIKNW